MAEPKTPLRDPITALLDFGVEVEHSAEEAEQELREMGVDVDGFLARAKGRRAEAADRDRTAWLTAAREGIKTEPRSSSSKYGAMGRQELIAEYRRRRHKEAQAYFHKLDEISDDDLRTLLGDLDDLDDGQEDPT